MPELLTVSAAGARIGIDLAGLDPAVVDAVRAAWRDAVTDGAPDEVVVPRAGQPLDALLSLLSQQVTLAAIDAGKGRGWMLHAAGVATDDGAVVVLVGPSGRGKTTASRTLGRHFGYVSDETIAIEADGTVHEYRKPLSIISDPGAPKEQVAPSELGLRPIPDARLRVAAVALLDRRSDHDGPPVVELLDLGDALEELVAQSSYLAHHAAPLRQIAAIVEATGGVRRLIYREADDLVDEVAALAASERVDAALAPLEAAVSGHSADVTDDGHARFTRTAAIDALTLGDPERIAVMRVDEFGVGSVHVLAGVAPAVWRAAQDATIGQLTEAALRAYGHPPDSHGDAAVRAAVAHLLDERLLVSNEPTYQRDGYASWVRRDEDVVALPLDGALDQPVVLSGSGALLWEWLEQQLTATQLFGRSVAAGAPRTDQAWAEIRDFLEDLVARGLVRKRRA